MAARLGHYALPNLTGTIKRTTRQVKGHTVQLIDNGTYQLALVTLRGWDQPAALDTKGLNPVKQESTILNVAATMQPTPAKSTTYATLMLWKKSGEPWKNEELLPVQKITCAAPNHSPVLHFADGRTQQLTFN